MNHFIHQISKLFFKIGIYFFFLFLAIDLAAQEPKFRQYSVNNGLPSATVYQVFQDSKAYIWFSSEAGLTRFDGVHWKTFSMDNGLPDNEIFGLFEDSQKRLWVKAFNGKYAYIKENKIYNASNTPFLKQMEQNDWISKIAEDKKGNIYFAVQSNGFVVLKTDGTIFKIGRSQLYLRLNKLATTFGILNDYAILNKRISIIGFKELKNGKIRVIANNGEFLFDPDTNEVNAIKIYKNELNSTQQVDSTTFLGMNDATTNTIFNYDINQGFTPLLTSQTIGANTPIVPFWKDGEELWVATLGDGTFVVQDYKTKPKSVGHYLKGKSVSWILHDKEGNTWFATLGNGVYMLPSNTVLTYTIEEGLSSNDLYSITGDEAGNIYIGTVNGKVDVLQENGTVRTLSTMTNDRGYNRIMALELDEKGNVWSGSDLGLTIFNKKIPYKKRYIKSLFIDKENNAYIGSSEKLVKISPNNISKTIWNKRTMAILAERDDFIWLGSNDGLFVYGGHEVVELKRENALFGHRVSDLAMTQDSILCVCTYGSGVILKDLNRIKQLTTKEGLVGNSCKDIFIDNQNGIWVSTNVGISKLTISKKELNIKRLTNYTEADNLASNDVRDIYAHDGKVWVATSAGLSFFEEAQQKGILATPPIYITGVKIWEQDTTLRSKYVLPYNQNNIKIQYAGLSFKSGNRIRYMTRMVGIDTTWVETENSLAQYPSLKRGSYKFEVKAITIDRIESDVASVSFVVLPPWWKTWWFISMTAISSLALTATIVYYIIQNNKYKDELRRQIVESEQMALRAQMNPHFIFNALNSIQHFITMEDEISANHYLTQFSKLVRQVLENSKKTFIYLTEEIETLGLYLELEMLRFDGKFEYTIESHEDINAYDVEIPSMVIQPFVENAIWHGLMPKQDNSHLKITFHEEGDFLVCDVIDNGIGREAARKLDSRRHSNHKSTGISNTVKRLGLLAHVKKQLVEIIDLKDEEGKALGTQVVIKIPVVRND